MKKNLGTIFTILLVAIFSNYYLGCKKTDHPFGINAPNGLDVPSKTPTPAIGAFNCYVYDGGGKQGVKVVLLDPTLSNPVTNTTDQFGNAVFNPSPLQIGTYTAEVLDQGRYGLSALPIIVSSTAQGPVSCEFDALAQALTIVSGAPASFAAGTGSFNIGVSYVQSGTLDVPVSISTNTLPSGWNVSPAFFILNMSQPETVLSVNKVGCAILNQPVSFLGSDFQGVYLANAGVTLMRNFPVNVQLYLTEKASTCTGAGGSYR